MQLIKAYQMLEQTQDAALLTRDVAGILGVDTTHASKILERLKATKLMVPIRKGVWAFPKRMDLILLPRYLAAPMPAYVSLQSALYFHDMIQQIPSVVYAVTLGRTKCFATALGEVSLHHIDPSFFFGFEVDAKTQLAVATPEKALLDFFYLSTAKTHLFTKLPEIELPKNFSVKKAKEMLKRIPSLQRRSLVEQKFETLCTR